ncbi:synaptogyrin-3-like [Corticium candelabrum]|uniref:synaptogyrin-3-like n=1 Tax=Corticium candelabrum TaxID=121492 RepID=UPI002E301370|nr:synaptogyrin-3-like [Corticium candelabrum]
MEPRKSALVRIAMRIFGLVAGAIVIGCIAGKLLENFSTYDSVFSRRVTEKICLFHLDDVARSGDFKKIACEFGIACGAMAVLVAVVFCMLDYMADVTGSVASMRRPIIVSSSVLAVIMVVVWVSCFGYLSKRYSDAHGNDWKSEYKTPGQATLAFSFLSIIAWIIVAVFGFVGLQASTDGVPKQAYIT